MSIYRPNSISMPPLVQNRGKLLIEGVAVETIAKRFGVGAQDENGGAAYVYSAGRIRENYLRLKDGLSKRAEVTSSIGFSASFPFSNAQETKSKETRTKILFAIKANSNPHIVNVLAEMGCGADCSNLNEVRIALSGGIEKKDIVFSGNNNQDWEIRKIANMGIAINFDDLNPFARMIGSGWNGIGSVPISFRLNTAVGLGENGKITTSGRESKFGIGEETILFAYEQAKKEGAARFGIHMMNGSNTLEVEPFAKQVRNLLQAAGKIGSELGIGFEFVDIGGGYGVPYEPGQDEIDAKRLGKRINEEFERGCKDFGVKGSGEKLPVLVVEPGRYLVADSGVLLAQVTNVKNLFGRKIIGLDASMASLMRPAMYDSYHHIYFEGREGAEMEKADIVGQACESSDFFARARMVPKGVEVGDIAIIATAGAYGYSMSSNYGNKGRPAEVLVDRVDSKLIRRREGISDMMSGVV